MEQQEKTLSEKESLELITRMINKAKDAYYDTGVSAIMWGAVIAFCSLEKLAELQFDYRLPFDIYLLTFAAVIPQIYFSVKEQRERKVKSYDDQYLDYIWMGFGICIFLTVLISNTIQANLNPLIERYNELAKGRADWTEYKFGEYVMSLYLLLYGLPTFITGAACKFKPMLWGGLFCWASCVTALYTPIKIDLLLTAASAIMAWFIPGLLMKKEYSIYIKEKAATNV
jgi:hypothetical protein